MHDLLVPDFALIEKWLRESGHEFYVCDQCSGLHISAFHTLEGVLDSRIFVEPWGLLFTTEMELRSSAILAVSADLPRLNMSFPTLKLFLNTPDEAPAMLVVTSTILTGQGLTMAQFYEFFGVAQEVLQKLLQECQQMQFLYTESDAHFLSEPEDGINPSYH